MRLVENVPHNLEDNIMRWYFGVPFSIGMVLIASLGADSADVPMVRPWDVLNAMIILTALWAGVDSERIKLRKYRSGLSYHPVVLFFAVALVWIVGFPWYLHVRYKIKSGLAELVEPGDIPDPLERFFLGLAIIVFLIVIKTELLPMLGF
ncbi:MAG: hypothetical protein VCD00_08775 [Candidatus Hydrogenedentota bacterium]